MTTPSSTSQSSGGVLRLDDVVTRAVDAGGGLHEHDRLRGNGQAGLLCVVGIVEPDGDELADADVGHAEARIAAHRRQRLGFERVNIFSPRGEISFGPMLSTTLEGRAGVLRCR